MNTSELININFIRFSPEKSELFREIMGDIPVIRVYKNVISKETIQDKVKFSELDSNKFYFDEIRTHEEDSLYRADVEYYIENEIDITHLSIEKQSEIISLISLDKFKFSPYEKIEIGSEELTEEVLKLGDDKFFPILKLFIKHRFTIHGYVNQIFERLTDSESAEVKELLKEYDPRIYHLI